MSANQNIIIMGGWSNRIAHYEVSQMDYYYDKIVEDGESLGYYESTTVEAKFKNLLTKEEKMVNVKLSDLHDFIKNEDGSYCLSNNENKNLFTWLWNTLKSNNVIIKSAFKLSVNIAREYWNNMPVYYLNSKIGDNELIVSTKKVEFEIEDLSQISWLASKGFDYA